MIDSRTSAPRTVVQSAELALRRIASDPRLSSDGHVQLARADIRGNRVLVRPERSDFPSFSLPNNVGAEGFSPSIFSHDYVVVNLAPPPLIGVAGLQLVGQALSADPTPGKDGPPSATGTRNDVGRLVWFDGGDNIVRTYTIPSGDPNRSTAIVDYTVQGEHAMSEGFVVRFARRRSDNRRQLIPYGEGNAVKQSSLTSPIWRREVTRVWTENVNAIFRAAVRGGR